MAVPAIGNQICQSMLLRRHHDPLPCLGAVRKRQVVKFDELGLQACRAPGLLGRPSRVVRDRPQCRPAPWIEKLSPNRQVEGPTICGFPLPTRTDASMCERGPGCSGSLQRYRSYRYVRLCVACRY
ncbi:predicted protein [Chaetomium globosum CBS 148.51]|uniref:Uncharacterized protein n=1 Tax=Chaetomium globosum (strain ATCC 6205 / CBS 148.51 / DSM 1962 / NBRC 6347 / NRRL 1970) TaxID=306901 RepID=Q2GXK4_CHAGB|nr:uncharacterized protein CHGG_07300 [Chaetomium globosum CBS 148.51]EAQ86047.1 predicted protein [Chaetomium globosum CBS 148.51]